MTKTRSHRRSSRILLMVLTGGLFAGVIADGLPGEYILTQRWRDLFSEYSPLTNPAFLTEENYKTLRVAFAPTLQGAFKLWEGGVTMPVGLYQSIGVSWFGLSSGSYPGSQVTSTGQVIEDTTGKTVSTQDNFFQLSYAINPWNRLSVGVNLDFALQSLFGESNFGRVVLGKDSIPGPGLDIGITYRLVRHPFFGDHVIGIDFQNILPLAVGRDVLSRDLRASWLATFWEKRIISTLDFDLKDFMAQAETFKSIDPTNPSQITEAAKKTEYELYYKLGFWVLRMFKLYGQFGVGENGSAYWGMAAGANLPSVNMGKDLELLYQFNSMAQGTDVTTHTLYARWQFGLHREEIYARKMARMLDASPNDLYNRALTLYSAGKYWDAFFLFGQILSQFPDFFKNDWVTYYAHSCQEMLDIRGLAAAGYNDAISKFAQSEMVPYADLGIMRVAYREGDNSGVARQFDKLNRTGVPDSLKYYAFYLMGQTEMRQQGHAKAVQLFSVIPDQHPAYPYAQHSLAVAYLLKDRSIDVNMPSAITALENAVQAQGPKSAALLELVNRSYLLLGYIFYEELQLSKAVTALRKIPASSYYYEDALLGLGWAAVKAQQWTDCTDAASTILKVSKKGALQCEARLLQAYSLLMRKNYADALSVLQDADAKIVKVGSPSKDSLDLRHQKYQSDRVSYEGIGKSAYDLAMVRSTSAVVKMVDSLHTDQLDVKGKIDEFLVYSDEFGRVSFFCRSVDRIKSDIEYALATAQKLSGLSKAKGATEVEKQKELESEIEKVKEQMKKLDQKK